MAAGYISTSGSEYKTLSERWTGKRWRIEPTGHGGVLDGVSCLSAKFCIAAGSKTGGAPPLVERWNGRRWIVQATPALHLVDGYKYPAQGYLDAVSCTSTSACMAVGSYTTYTSPGYTSGPLVERWDGRNWTITPTPDQNDYRVLSAVSCASANRCTAVGEDASAERWNGRRWTIQNAANVYDGSLLAISCPSRRYCNAVGYNQPRNTGGPSAHETLAERWQRG